MAQVRFTLHHKRKDGKYSILLWYRCDGGRIYRQLMGENIQKRNWSTKTQRALPSITGAFGLNRYLDEQEEKIVDAVRQIRLSQARITPEAIKSYLSGAKMGFWAYVDSFLESPPQEVGPGTLKVYKRLFNNLRELFPSIEFSDVGQPMVDSYIKKRRKQGKNDSTIRTELNKFRAFLTYAKRAQILKVVPDLELNISGVDPGEIYLSDKEIMLIYNLIGKIKEFKEIEPYIRYFVLGTQIGVRVSDLRIDPANIKTLDSGQKVIEVMPGKTNDRVVIPLSSLAVEILQYFKWSVPNFHDQHLNLHIKTAARLAGLKDPCVWREKIDGKLIETVYEKWQLVSSHTMRRSFATNLYKRGAPSLFIMKITGHRTESSFLKYIRVSKQEAAEAISQYL